MGVCLREGKAAADTVDWILTIIFLEAEGPDWKGQGGVPMRS